MSDIPPKLPTRSCRYCKAKFKPIRQDQRFCKPAHRKSFWKYGGLPYDKMREQIMKDVRKLISETQAEALARFDQRWEELKAMCLKNPPDPRYAVPR